MTHYFDKLSDAESKAFFDAYLSHREERLAYLQERYAETTDRRREQLDFSPESLIPLWRWAIDVLVLRNTGEPPVWLIPYSTYDVTSIDDWLPKLPEAMLIDAIAFYFADVCIKNLRGVHWEICHVLSIDHNQPVLGGFKYTPFQPRVVVASAVVGITSRGEGQDGLFRMFKMLANQAGAAEP